MTLTKMMNVLVILILGLFFQDLITIKNDTANITGSINSKLYDSAPAEIETNDPSPKEKNIIITAAMPAPRFLDIHNSFLNASKASCQVGILKPVFFAFDRSIIEFFGRCAFCG